MRILRFARVAPGMAVLGDPSRSDGEFSVRVPLTKGTTVVDVVITGRGEQRIYQRSFHTAQLLVPRRRVEYGATLGACTGLFDGGARQCRAAGNADVRYGLGAGWTIRAGTDVRLTTASERIVQPYFGPGGVVARALLFDGSFVPRAPRRPSWTPASVRYEPAPSFALGASYDGADPVAVTLVSDGKSGSVVNVPIVARAKR